MLSLFTLLPSLNELHIKIHSAAMLTQSQLSIRIEGSPRKEWLWTVAESKWVVTHIVLSTVSDWAISLRFHILLSTWHFLASKCKDLLLPQVHFYSLSLST